MNKKINYQWRKDQLLKQARLHIQLVINIPLMQVTYEEKGNGG